MNASALPGRRVLVHTIHTLLDAGANPLTIDGRGDTPKTLVDGYLDKFSKVPGRKLAPKKSGRRCVCGCVCVRVCVTFPRPQGLELQEGKKALEDAKGKKSNPYIKKNLKDTRDKVEHLTEIREQLNNKVRSPEIKIRTFSTAMIKEHFPPEH